MPPDDSTAPPRPTATGASADAMAGGQAKTKPLIEALPEPPRAIPAPRQMPERAAPLESAAGSAQTQGLLRQAHALRTRGDFTGALRLADQAIDAAPGDAAAHSMRGDILRQAGKLKEALQAYETAKDLLPAGSAKSAAEAKIARVALEINPSRAEIDFTAGDRVRGPAVVWATAFIPGLGQLLSGSTMTGGVLLGIWLVSSIALLANPASAALVDGLLHLPNHLTAPSSGSEFLAVLTVSINFAAWLFAMFDAVAIVRRKV